MRRNETEHLRVNVGGARNIARKLLKDAGVKEIPVSLYKIIRHMETQHNLEVLRFPLGAVDGLLVMVTDTAHKNKRRNHLVPSFVFCLRESNRSSTPCRKVWGTEGSPDGGRGAA